MTDKIILYLTPDKTLKVFVNHLNYIKNEVLAKDVVIKNELEKEKILNMIKLKHLLNFIKLIHNE